MTKCQKKEIATKRQALVTGVSSGIGQELSRELLGGGYKVYGISTGKNDVWPEDMNSCLNAGRLVHIKCDLADTQDYIALFKDAGLKFSELSVIVFCAGTNQYGSFLDIALEEHLNILKVNLTSIIEMTYTLVKKIKNNPRVNIMYVSSTSSLKPMMMQQMYHVSKSGLNSFFRSVYFELKRTGIFATLVIPGSVSTPFWTRGGLENLPRKFNFLRPRSVARKALNDMFRNKKYCLVGPRAYIQFYIFGLLPWIFTDYLINLRGKWNEPKSCRN